MDMMAGLKASFSGLNAQKMRMNIIASNLANVNTTRTPEGGPYRRKEAIFAAQPRIDSFEALLRGRLQDGIREARVIDIVNDPQGTRLEYDPNHPDANAQGFVTLPNINLMREMVDLMLASRSYEANVTAINALKEMALRALQIGRI